MVVLLAGVFADAYFSRPEATPDRKSFRSFPDRFGDWNSVREHRINDRSMEILKVDDYVMRDYRNSRGEEINLYIGYFNSQREGKSIHSPRQCLPGAGWLPLERKVQWIKLFPGRDACYPVNRMIFEKGLDRRLLLFWYYGRGRIYASEYMNKVYLIHDSIARGRTDGALVTVMMRTQEDAEPASGKLLDFINRIFPALAEYIPE